MRRHDRSHLLVVNALGLAVVALVLRVWRLGSLPGINGDEAWSGAWVMALLQGQSVPWRTPTGNPVNLFFLLPLAALHTVFSPSFVVLRLVPLASGLAALVVNYLFCRRVFEARTAVVSTLLLALLPIDIAYSRFAWDASQSLLATLLVLYLPLAHYRRRPGTAALPLAGMIALAAALVVHPTNLFAAPLVVMPLAYAWRHAAWQKFQQLSVPGRPRSLVWLVAVGLALAYFAWLVLARLADLPRGPESLFDFLRNYLALFSGATVYEYIAGVDAAHGSLAAYAWLPALCKLLFGLAVVAGVFGMLRRLSHQAGEAGEADVCLVAGWAVMLVSFFVVAGPEAIAPHRERYGICLIAPGALVLARGLAWWIEPARLRARQAGWLMAAAAWLFPLTFYLGYFAFIERTGGMSHLTFRTAAVEPKLAALRSIDSQRDGDPVQIVASQWWIYWPLVYLAAAENNVQVISGHDWQPRFSARTSGDAPTWDDAPTWYVEFSGSPQEAAVIGRLHEAGEGFQQTTISDYAGRGLISLTKTRGKPLQNY